LEFQHDVISVLLFGTEKDQPDIPREQNVFKTYRKALFGANPTNSKQEKSTEEVQSLL